MRNYKKSEADYRNPRDYKNSKKNHLLINARKKLRMSTTETAQKMGITYISYKRYEENVRYPSLQKQKMICDFFRSMGVFLYEDDVFPKNSQRKNSQNNLYFSSSIPDNMFSPLSPVNLENLVDNNSPDKEALIKDEIKLLYKVLETFPRRTQEIIKLRWGFEGDPMSFRKTATIIRLSYEQIRLIEVAALIKIRKRLLFLEMPKYNRVNFT